jgi:YjbE family integral membrane protein
VESLSAIVSIVLINIILSGDNAVVIGMAAHSLPERQRKFAILFGGIAAVVLRIVLTGIAAVLLLIPGLKFAGGLMLIWIGFSLLKLEEEEQGSKKAAHGLRSAIVTILIADFIMSLDNILAVAAAAHGNVQLLVFGLLVSMPIVMFTGSIVASLINRLWWLAYVGAALIVWTGGDMLLEDEVTHHFATEFPILTMAIPLALSVIVVSFSHWYHRRPSRTQQTETVPVLASDGSGNHSD